MKQRILIASFLFLAALAVGCDAQQREDPQRQEMRDRVLKRFDKDGDGKLSAEERTELRQFLESRRGKQSNPGKAKIPEGLGRMPEPEPKTLLDLYGAPAPSLSLIQKEFELRDQERDKVVQFRATFPDGSTHKLPVIVWSHGMYGSQDFYDPLVGHWAKHGYLVLQPTHSDSLRRGEGLSNPTSDWASRPEDVTFLLDSLASHPILSNKADLSRVGVGGHSFGAHTSVLLSGAKPRTGQALADPRPKAFVAISPPEEDRLLTSSSWKGLLRPMLFISGDNDETRKGNSSSLRLAPYQGAPPGEKYLLWIKGAYHNFGGIAGARHSKSGPANGDQVALVKSATLAFWDKYLKSDPTASKLIDQGLYNKESQDLATWSQR